MEKANKESKNEDKECDECAENRNKAERLLEDLSDKELKWNATLNKLREELNKIEREKVVLENENIELRNRNDNSDDEAPDSGFRTQEGR